MDIASARPKFEQVVQHFQSELASLRTGRAHPSLVEQIPVEHYGTRMPLRDLASITCPESNLILIQPWDQTAVKAIEKAIQVSSIGIHPAVDGHILRLVLPPMTEERRRDLTKALKEKLEAGRVSIRNIREDIWKSLRAAKEEGAVSEDVLFQRQKELQKVVDEYNAQLQAIGKQKESEIMTI